MAIANDNTEHFERLSRYFSGHLNDAEAAQFEGDWINNPRWTAEMELDARMQAGLGELQRSGQMAAAMRGPWWVSSLRMMSLAASVAVIAVAGWVWHVSAHAGATLLTRSPSLAVGNSVAVMRLRQSSRIDAAIQLPSRRAAIEIRAMPEAVDAPIGDKYSMSIVSDAAVAGRSLPWVDDLPLGKDGFVHAFVDSGQLATGRYRLSLRRAGSADVSEFLLDVGSVAASQDGN